MYVACTRAKEHLYITYPINVYDRESGMVLSKPSRFIANMPEHLLDTWVVDDQ
jgi:DNA helicase-2/ATP-dependent DNA helicase PcrA